jgi:L-rhamnose mutarotase
MRRYGQVIRLREGHEEEYMRLHRAVWPEIQALIYECNLRNYSIYFKDGYLFAYFEYIGDDYDADMKRMSDHPVNQRWWDLCKPCQEPLESRGKEEWWANMVEVFHQN